MRQTVVIGSGIAGLNAALVSARYGKVAIITKDRMEESATRYAQGGIASVQSKDDNFRLHFQDTIRAGAYHNNRNALNFLVEMGPASIKKLEDFGVHFTKSKGKLMLTMEGGHSRRRIAFVADRTGRDIEETLIRKVKQNKRITVYERAIAKDLIIKKGRCVGIELIQRGMLETIPADVTVIATGGIGELYEYTTNPRIATGDGIAIGFRAGAQMKDMEFIQFHPTALRLEGKPSFLLSEALRGEGAYLLNHKYERFMHKYDERLELAPRDIVARAVNLEMKKGKVYLDITHKDHEFIRKRFPTVYHKLLTFDIDMTKTAVPIAPAAHYLCGGIKVDIGGATNIKNLFAFGETACTGVHGANRLASNSLLEGIVFSEQMKRVKKIHGNGERIIEKTRYRLGRLTKNEKKRLGKLRADIKRLMWNNAGIIRHEKWLRKALIDMAKIKDEAKMIPLNNESLEITNMATTGLLILKAALKRRKSIGCHYREDAQ
jgi:L-aspartate oxidase